MLCSWRCLSSFAAHFLIKKQNPKAAQIWSMDHPAPILAQLPWPNLGSASMAQSQLDLDPTPAYNSIITAPYWVFTPPLKSYLHLWQFLSSLMRVPSTPCYHLGTSTGVRYSISSPANTRRMHGRALPLLLNEPALLRALLSNSLIFCHFLLLYSLERRSTYRCQPPLGPMVLEPFSHHCRFASDRPSCQEGTSGAHHGVR